MPLLAVLALLGGCSSGAPGGRPIDPPPLRDAGPDSPFFPDDGGHDAGTDAGPPPTPVIGPQAYTISLQYVDPTTGTFAMGDFTLVLDARAETGSVRAVAGGHGDGSTLVFDFTREGHLYSTRPIQFGVERHGAITSCTSSAAAVRIEMPSLELTDRDGDGIHESLTSIGGAVSTVDSSGYVYMTGSPPSSLSIADDMIAPTLRLVPDAPLAGEPFDLTASEPLDPSFAPRVVGGGRSFPLEPVGGATSSGRWRLPAVELPAGVRYDLVLDGTAADLSGHAVETLPTLSFDAAVRDTLVFDGFESGVSGVVSSVPPRLTDASMGETPIGGLQSVFVEDRAIVTLDPPSTATSLQFNFRIHGPASTTYYSWFELRDAHGMYLSSTAGYGSWVQASTIAGFEMESYVASAYLPIPRHDGPLMIVLYPNGNGPCVGLPESSDRVGLVIDDFAAF